MKPDELAILAYLATHDADSVERDIFFCQFNAKRVRFILSKWSKAGKWTTPEWATKDGPFGLFTSKGAAWAAETLGMDKSTVCNCPTNAEAALIERWENGDKDEFLAAKVGRSLFIFIPDNEEAYPPVISSAKKRG